ncbi:MAG: hypothetical protein WBC01_01090 [Solirubrobacterales bacterium]
MEVVVQAGVPALVGQRRLGVETIREEWLVEDRWWTYSPLRRHYFELVLESGRCVTIFRDIAEGGWFEQ